MSLAYSQLDSAFGRMAGLESVTYTPYSASSATTAGTTVTGVSAYRKKERDRNAAGGGLLTSNVDTTTFCLRDSMLSSATPKINDTITDADSVVWTITAVSRDGMDSRWVCQCTRRRTT